MKIDSTGPVRPSSLKRRGKTGKAEKKGGFAEHLDSGEDSSGAVTAASPTQSVDAVLAIQGVPDSTAGAANARARQWGFATLDQLEQVRIDLLIGAIPKGRLINLARMVSERRERSDDPNLVALLDEIELRVRVEIAKYAPRDFAVSRR